MNNLICGFYEMKPSMWIGWFTKKVDFMKWNQVCELVDLPKREQIGKVPYANAIIYAILLGWLVDIVLIKDIKFGK